MFSQIHSLIATLTISQVLEVSSTVMSFPPRNASLLAGLHSTVTADPRYQPWPDSSAILYHIDSNYTSRERIMILGAMITISTDMTHCIQFQEYDAQRDSGKDFLYISKTLNDGTMPPTCVTFFGRVLRAAGRGQKLVIHDGPNGCMASSREIMKVLANVLGLRNEYRRPDRDRFMTVNVQNMLPELRDSSLMKPYNESEVYYSTPFDYHSLTILPSTKYSTGNKTIFTFPDGMSVPTMDYLSLNDCIGLSWIYGCDLRNCRDPYISGNAVGMVAVSKVASVTAVPSAESNTRTAKSNDIGFVLLSPEQYTSNTSSNNATNTIFHLAASKSNNSLGPVVFGKGEVPNISGSFTNTAQKFGDSRVNISVSYTQNGSTNGMKTFVLDKNMTLADIMSSQTGPVTLHLENFSNVTAYVGIYGPPGFTSNFITALNTSAVVFNGTGPSVNYTMDASYSTTTVRSNNTTRATSTSTTTTATVPVTSTFLPPLPVLIP